MGFSILPCEQRSDAWRLARAGRLTSTCAADMLATLKSGKGEAAGRRNLRMRLALERLTGKPIESGYQSLAMQQGIEREADALAAYQALTGEWVERTGFLVHDELHAGTSLDGHVGDFEGLVEAKCPIPATHAEYLKTSKVPHDYLCQITHHLWITGAQWADFLSFQPDFPDRLRVKLVRVKRADVDLAAYEMCVRLFLKEVQQEFEELAALDAAGVTA